MQLNVTVTLELFHPLALGAGEAVAIIVGPLSSRLMVALVVAVYPALFTAVPEITWFAPALETTTGFGHCAISETASEQAKVTVAGWLFQPALLGAGDTLATIVGGVSPMLITETALAVRPAVSVTVPVIV